MCHSLTSTADNWWDTSVHGVQLKFISQSLSRECGSPLDMSTDKLRRVVLLSICPFIRC